MGNSPTDMHTHDMLVFFLNHIVGPELAPPVQRGSSLPPLYISCQPDMSKQDAVM